MSETIRSAGPGDRRAIESLLREANLPVPDPSEHRVEFVVAELEERVVACGGWEIHEGHALLRSIAVARGQRSRGIGERIVQESLARLDRRHLASVSLVTLDADGFFTRLGFVPIDRDQVPDPVRSSPEFSAHDCLGGQWMLRGG